MERSRPQAVSPGGAYCARLITTRNRDTLPGDSQTVDLDAMRPSEAVQLLSGGLPPELASSVKKRKALEALAARLGEWPLLLEFVNRALRRRIEKMSQVSVFSG